MCFNIEERVGQQGRWSIKQTPFWIDSTGRPKYAVNRQNFIKQYVSSPKSAYNLKDIVKYGNLKWLTQQMTAWETGLQSTLLRLVNIHYNNLQFSVYLFGSSADSRQCLPSLLPSPIVLQWIQLMAMHAIWWDFQLVEKSQQIQLPNDSYFGLVSRFQKAPISLR